jgi:hypothetical protein
MVNNGAFGSFLFRSINGMGVARLKVRAAVGGNEGEGNRVFREEMV